MFGKRKDRPKTVGDSSTSPEDQRSRQTFIVEYPDKEDDDEALKALSMVADLGKELNETLERLTKLDVIENLRTKTSTNGSCTPNPTAEEKT